MVHSLHLELKTGSFLFLHPFEPLTRSVRAPSVGAQREPRTRKPSASVNKNGKHNHTRVWLLIASWLPNMPQSTSASTICLAFIILLVVAQIFAAAPTGSNVLKSLVDLNAAVVSAPLLLVLFDPFSPKSSGIASTSTDIECSAGCRKLLSLCEGAAVLQLPQRSRITCALAQGDREWMKMCVLLLQLFIVLVIVITRR